MLCSTSVRHWGATIYFPSIYLSSPSFPARLCPADLEEKIQALRALRNYRSCGLALVVISRKPLLLTFLGLLASSTAALGSRIRRLSYAEPRQNDHDRS